MNKQSIIGLVIIIVSFGLIVSLPEYIWINMIILLIGMATFFFGASNE